MVLTPNWQMGRSKLRMSKLYVSASEHPAVLCGGRFAPENVVILSVMHSGEVDLDALDASLADHDMSDGLPLVAIQHANNETGAIQPIRFVAAIVKARGGILVVDAVQTYGRIQFDISDCGGDFFIVSSHKIGGPNGVGALIGSTDLMMPLPLSRGGGQEKGYRSGTEALPSIAGFGAAAHAALARIDRIEELMAKRYAIETLIMSVDPTTIIHSRNAIARLPNTVFFSMPGLKSETAHIAFDLQGIALSSGSACSSGKVGASHVLKSMGYDCVEGALRVSICLETSDADVVAFGDALAKIAARRTVTHFDC